MNKLLFKFCVRFLKQEKNLCWVWPGNIQRRYGYLHVNKKRIRAHRLSYELFYQKIPKNLIVCHKCDNPPCINPSHLFLGTQKDNVLDAINKKRHKTHFIKLKLCNRGHVFSKRIEKRKDGRISQRCDECRKYQKGGIFYGKK